MPDAVAGTPALRWAGCRAGHGAWMLPAVARRLQHDQEHLLQVPLFCSDRARPRQGPKDALLPRGCLTGSLHREETSLLPVRGQDRQGGPCPEGHGRRRARQGDGKEEAHAARSGTLREEGARKLSLPAQPHQCRVSSSPRFLRRTVVARIVEDDGGQGGH